MPQKGKRTLRHQRAGQRVIEHDEQRKRLRLAEETRNEGQEEGEAEDARKERQEDAEAREARNGTQEDCDARRRLENYVKKQLKRSSGAIISEGEVQHDVQLRWVLHCTSLINPRAGPKK